MAGSQHSGADELRPYINHAAWLTNVGRGSRVLRSLGEAGSKPEWEGFVQLVGELMECTRAQCG